VPTERPSAKPGAHPAACPEWYRPEHTNQRLLLLDFAARNASLAVTAPATNNLAPPGDYPLFVVDVDGVPSMGSFVRVAVR
jgi:hypothetical protein